MSRVVAGDIGGTKTLLRCVEASGEVSAEQRYESGAHATFDELLHKFIPLCPGPIDSACFAVAGPVVGDRAEITNLKWVMEKPALASAFAIPRLTLINDFTAVALGVPLLTEVDLLCLQKGIRDRSAPMAILGAGTGLGQAMVVFDGEQWTVIPSEGGHADFAPQNREQTLLLLKLLERWPHVSWERVCSGNGIANIYEYVAGRKETPARVAELAASGDAEAVKTMEIFVDVYGSEAGNMALRVLARGGVFLAGGVAAKNREYFTDGRFVAAFQRKGRFSKFMSTLPVDLITNQQVGLMGALEMARRAVR
jgi:glucokinase